MKSSAAKIQMTGFDDLFRSSPDVAADGKQVQEISLSELHPFKNHPFRVQDDDAMEKMVKSIAENGVLVPGIARPRPEGGYEIVAGHRRSHASERAGKKTMPFLVKNLDDDEATIIMVDSNVQREKVLPSEKAWAYKMKLEALKHQGARRDLTLARGVPKLPARDQVAQDAGEKSGMAVTRYISLTKLVPPLLELVDMDKLSISAAADYLSDLPEKEQTDLVTVMEKLDVIPAKSQLIRIKQYSKEGTLTIIVIDAILSEVRPTAVQVTLKKDRLTRYFPPAYTAQQMEEVIVSLLEAWSIQQQT